VVAHQLASLIRCSPPLLLVEPEPHHYGLSGRHWLRDGRSALGQDPFTQGMGSGHRREHRWPARHGVVDDDGLLSEHLHVRRDAVAAGWPDHAEGWGEMKLDHRVLS